MRLVPVPAVWTALAALSGALAGCIPAATECAGSADCPGSTECRAGVCKAVGAVGHAGEGEGEGDAGAEGEGEGDHLLPGGEGEGEGDVPIPPIPPLPVSPTEFEHIRRLTVPAAHVHGSVPLTSFPLLVRITDPNLRDKSLGGAVRGGDIAFFAELSTTPLPVDVESRDPVTGSLVAWVRVPSLSPTADTAFVLAWGRDTPLPSKKSEVWDPTYRAVWHLGDKPSGLELDSTSRHNNGVPKNIADGDVVAGIVGNGLRMQNVNQTVEITSDDLDVSGSVSIEAWARVDDAASSFQRIYHKGDAFDHVLELFVEDEWTELGATTFRVDFDDYGPWPRTQITSFQYGQWHHYVGVFDASQRVEQLYVDGVQKYSVDAATDSIETGYPVTHLGNWDSGLADELEARNFAGVLDEVRVAKGALSAGWIGTAYENEKDPSGFVIVGPDGTL